MIYKEIASVEIVEELLPETAQGIGNLMPDLSARLPNESIDTELLQAIIDSPDRDLFIARVHGRIVGSAVMNLIIFTSGKKAWLEDFVVSSEESVRGKGVGYALWTEIVAWSREREAPLEFTSSVIRTTAHEFYLRQGAKIRPTTVFRYDT